MIFIKHAHIWLVIMVIYVGELNIMSMIDVISHIVSQLNGEVDMKDFGETTLCLGVQIEHLVVFF